MNTLPPSSLPMPGSRIGFDDLRIPDHRSATGLPSCSRLLKSMNPELDQAATQAEPSGTTQDPIEIEAGHWPLRQGRDQPIVHAVLPRTCPARRAATAQGDARRRSESPKTTR